VDRDAIAARLTDGVALASRLGFSSAEVSIAGVRFPPSPPPSAPTSSLAVGTGNKPLGSDDNDSDQSTLVAIAVAVPLAVLCMVLVSLAICVFCIRKTIRAEAKYNAATIDLTKSVTTTVVSTPGMATKLRADSVHPANLSDATEVYDVEVEVLPRSERSPSCK